jgi:hypothetical protein
MSPFDREAPWWAESPTHEALAPSDGANTIRKLTVRFVSTTTPEPKPRGGRPHSLSRPVFCFQGAACARGTYPMGFWCRFAARIVAVLAVRGEESI